MLKDRGWPLWLFLLSDWSLRSNSNEQSPSLQMPAASFKHSRARSFFLSPSLSVFLDGTARLQDGPWSLLWSSHLPQVVTGPKLNHRGLVRTRQWGTKKKKKKGGYCTEDGWRTAEWLPPSSVVSLVLWPPVSSGDKSHSHKNLMKRLGKGARARTHRLKACVKFGEGQVMPDIHSYQLQPRSIGRKRRCRGIRKRREASWLFSWQTGNETGRSKREWTNWRSFTSFPLTGCRCLNCMATFIALTKEKAAVMNQEPVTSKSAEWEFPPQAVKVWLVSMVQLVPAGRYCNYSILRQKHFLNTFPIFI